MVVFTPETDNPFSKSGMRSVCMGIYNGANISSYLWINSLRKLPTFGDATTGFPTKWRLRNERRNSILMRRHFPDLGSASDWLSKISHAARPFRSTARAQIWVVTRHQYGISALVSQTSFGGETSAVVGSVAKYRLFSQARELMNANKSSRSLHQIDLYWELRRQACIRVTSETKESFLTRTNALLIGTLINRWRQREYRAIGHNFH